MGFIKKIFVERRLKFDITSIFTLLLAATTFFIISYTYLKIHSSILNFAETTITRAGKIILEKVTCFSKEFQEIPQACDSLIISAKDVSETNKPLIYYLQRKLLLHPIVFGIYFGTTDGGMLNVENISQTKQKTFYTNPIRSIPKEACFVIETINRSAATAYRIRKYVDAHLNLLTEESIFPIDYDPRTRPWYKGAISSKSTFWTPPYTFIFPPVFGMTVSSPYYSDINSEILGIVGVDLTLKSVSDFIKEQQISKNGHAYIIDNATGQIVLPIEYAGKNTSDLQLSILEKSYQQFKQSKKNSFSQEINSEKYLVSILNMPESFNDRWLIAVIAPLEDFFFEILRTQKIVILISIIIFFLATLLIVIFSRKISKPITTIANEVDKITHFDFSSSTRIKSNIKEIKILDTSVANMRETINSFAKYVPKDIVRQLIKQGKGITLGGEKKQIVVMFTDIENFTPIAEKHPTDELMSLLAEYFDPMSKIILDSQGTIDKYIGDSIMAFWGAPENVNNPWDKACKAALYAHRFNIEFNHQRINKQLPPFPTRYGLSIGQAIVGNIGTAERINYTALGDIVNIASRLQSTNKVYNTSILITQELYELIKDRFITRPVDQVLIKGKEIKIKIHELIAEDSQDPKIGASEKDKTLAAMSKKAFEAIESGYIEDAVSQYSQILKFYPKDGLASFWLKKLRS